MKQRVAPGKLDYFIAMAWLINGFFCKVMNLVSRHQEIVARILGDEHARSFTLLIGLAETGMAVWIFSGVARKFNAIVQMTVIAAMNALEFILAPDLLLWGRMNALFALLFIILIFYNNFSTELNLFNNCKMFSFLKNHPFAVEAFFDSSIVITFAVPKEQLQSLIPGCLALDTFQDKWGFIAVAMVQTKGLRPKGFPQLLGSDFFLIGYRVFVRFTNKAGKNLRGLYILKSETDKKKMEFFGNMFTHYNYTTTDVIQTRRNGMIEVYSKKSGFKIKVENGTDGISLPANSPFADWKEARRFAGPLPFTFTCHSNKNEVLIIEGVRENWKPSPVKVIDHDFNFLNNLRLTDVVLANAFIIENIPYYWKKGKLESWKKTEENFRVS